MVFTSPFFLFFFMPLTAIIHYLLREKFRNIFLFIVSSMFYYYGEQNLLFLMYFVIITNWGTGLVFEYIDKNVDEIKRGRLKKTALWMCCLICIGLLWHYKYWNFTLETFSDILALAGVSYNISQVDKIILPLGISFYTFHSLSYTYDVYYGKMKAEHNLLNFMSYVIMFPQLVAGPIVRYIDIKRQFEHRVVTLVGVVNGIRRFCFGIAKKVLIANTLARTADIIFALNVDQLNICTAWLGMICYMLQLYFDFSGYSDMAIGLAMLFGFHYKENFNYPYISKTIGEFWQRWHISLATWLRDYVYIPLGGSRVAKWRYYFNIIIVFFLSGLWHGAQWNMILWGIWNGIFMIFESMGLRNLLKKNKAISHVYAFMVIAMGMVMFRANDVSHALQYWMQLFDFSNTDFVMCMAYLKNDIKVALIAGIFFSIDWRGQYKKIVCAIPYKHAIFTAKFISMIVAFSLFILSVMSLFSNAYNPFIYFRF